MATVEREEHTLQAETVQHTDRSCLKCGKYNHFASCCRISAQPQERPKEPKRGRIKKTTEAEET